MTNTNTNLLNVLPVNDLINEAIHIDIVISPIFQYVEIRHKRSITCINKEYQGWQQEVIDYTLFPSESISDYESLLTSMKERGVKKVHLFVSDGFKDLAEICQNIFSTSLYQRCWVLYLTRNVKGCVRKQDIKDILDDLKPIYSSTTEEAATNALVSFLET